jgi:putative Ca2+/H+ antiporter (TMEM165/GDT1 family)
MNNALLLSATLIFLPELSDKSMLATVIARHASPKAIKAFVATSLLLFGPLLIHEGIGQI